MMRSGTKKETNPIISEVADGLAVLKIINQFALDLTTLETRDDLAWYVAHRVVGKRGFADCVICFVDADNKRVRQQAAFGNKKNPASDEIANVLDIAIDTGVIGTVVGSGQSLVVDDVEKFDGYIIDIEPARSEICVPIMVNGQVFGAIDCEDPR
ncbi:MAG TPA: GAF domain-containing protein, partial [Rhodospirillales bacterium]|nr:GAF domain-containing protein [Rhodospirillales bacterium]